MRRLGDRLGGTRVEDAAPERYGRGDDGWSMLGSVALRYGALQLAPLLVAPALAGL